MISFKESEKVISIYRRHKFIILAELFPIVIFSLVVVSVSVFVIYMFFSDYLSFIYLILFLMLLFLHLFWIIAFILFADYYLDIWILTDKRVVTIEQKSLFSRVVSEFELEKIQEITVDIHGVIPTLLDFGDVRVRTASENRNFVFKQVKNPNRVKDEIFKAMTEEKNKS